MRLLPMLVAALIAPSAGAQDMPGAVDLSGLSRSQVQSATARGYAERDGGGMSRGPNGVPLTARARAYCEDYPNLRARHGASDARVVRLASACRRAGYPY